MPNRPCHTCSLNDRGLCKELLTSADVTDTQSKDHRQDFQVIHSGENIFTRGKPSEHVYILCEGWAFQFIQLQNGRRQIVHLFMPNDLLAPVTVFLHKTPASIGALTSVRLSRVRLTAVHDLLAKTPAISVILAQSCHDHSIHVESLLTAVGQLNSEQRLAFLILHLMQRASRLGAVHDLKFKVPLRQQHVADLLGLTPVHVNRVVSKFKSEKIADFSNGHITVHNLPELERLGVMEL